MVMVTFPKMNASPASITILAPLSGPLVPLESVPDPVFSARVVGDGVAIDPVGDTLIAPAAGVVVQLHRAHHALTLRTDEGFEILMHVGIDTVQLQGEGFSPLVRSGERVRAGQPLLRFDADAIARRAPSLVTVVLVANGESVARLRVAPGPVRAGIDALFHLEPARAMAAVPAAESSTIAGTAPAGEVQSSAVSVPNAAGLHARPAAILAQAARRFAGEVRIERAGDVANAKSVTAILLLAVRAGDIVHVRASGRDAMHAAEELSALIAAGCGESHAEAPVQAPLSRVAGEGQGERVVATPPSGAGENPRLKARGLYGTTAAPGLALGRVLHMREAEIHVEEQGAGAVTEAAHLHAALARAGQEIEALQANAAGTERARILDAHREVLEDPDLQQLAQVGLSKGHSAGFAWRAAYLELALRMLGLESALLRERANDIRDVGRRVLAHLAAAPSQADPVQRIAPDSVLIAEELAPSVIAALDRGALAGICTTGGGATSHVAILARSLGIPAICGIDAAACALADGSPVLVDADGGRLVPDPDAGEIALARAAIAQREARHAQERTHMHELASTADGHRIEVAANVAGPGDARAAAEHGAEGVGLLRSEFLFGDRESEPSEDEQAAAYAAVARAMGPGRRVVVRTLDVGGDKPLSYLPMPAEENPFLGVRGIRVSLEHPEMLGRQLRAILRCAKDADLHIMFPMIATIEELRRARAALDAAERATGMHARVGIMIEVPAAVLIADRLAPEVDFFSIGTNDLTQYTLAMDRGHPRLAAQADALHPSVLRLISMTCEAAHAHGKWVGVCGGIAAEPLAVPALVGLGVDELSVPAPGVPAVKAKVRTLRMPECRALGREIIAMASAGEVRERLAKFGA
jgi:phosphoenolpyruvate-protein phosphotransferase